MRALSELMAILPVARTKIVVPDDLECPPAFAASVEGDVNYVMPGVTNVSIPGDARVVLVEAIGATGKSAAARAIASNRRWPLIDSAKAQIGEYSLTGLLYDATGHHSTLISEIATGDTGLVIDALDEAHLRVGTSNFLAFIDNVINLSHPRGGNGISIVLMSRPDTAEIVRERFRESDRSLGTLRLDFFDIPQARAYVMQHLKRIASAGRIDIAAALGKYRQAFEELRESRMLAIGNSLVDTSESKLESLWPQVRTFLGYAPVLSVLAESIAVSNPHKEIQNQANLGRSANTILQNLVESILDRESGKFHDQLSGLLQAKAPVQSDWIPRNLYSREEQVDRLLSAMHGFDGEVAPPLTLPVELQSLYERKASQFVLDHPMVSSGEAVNIVFGDYLQASLFADPNHGLRQPELPNSPKVGPFFFRFAHSVASRLQGAESPVIAEVVVPSLIRSVNQTIDNADGPYWVFTQENEEATIELRDENEQGFLSFGVRDLSGVLEFDGSLRFGVIFTDESLRLDGRDGVFHLGPTVLVVASEIEIGAESLSVETVGGKASLQVAMIADRWNANLLRKVSVPDPSMLKLRGADAYPALRQFCQSGGSDYYVSMASYVDLRAIFRFFRKTVHSGDRIIPCERLDQRVIGGNENRADLLKALIALGIVYRDKEFYCLNSSLLTTHEVGLASIMSGQPEVKTINFLAKLGRTS